MTRQMNRSNDSTNAQSARLGQTGAAKDARNNQATRRAKSDEPTSTLADFNQIDLQEAENEISLEEVDADAEDLSAIAADDVVNEHGTEQSTEQGNYAAAWAEDEDKATDQTDAVGEAAVGGTVAKPEQNSVDNLGAATGVEIGDRTVLRSDDNLRERDDRRWELDSKSSADYQERRD